MTEKPIIEVSDLKVQYGNMTILEDVNFDIFSGEIFVIVGGSGCGKSTLLRQVIGLEHPTKGTVRINDEDFTNSKGKIRNRLMQKYGVLFQSGGLLASMSIGENIALSLERQKSLSKEDMDTIIDLKLNIVGLSGYRDFIPSEISGGMKKRAALARAMALDPDILCFDEPSSGLDPVTSASLDKLILELNLSLHTTMIVVSHDLSSIMSIAHRVIMLDKDKKGIIATGTPQELKFSSNEFVYKFFNRLS